MEESTKNAVTNAQQSSQTFTLSSKLPRLSIQLTNLIKILSDKSAITMIREINKKARITDLYNTVSHLNNEIENSVLDQNEFSEQFRQIASDLIKEISEFKDELNESKKIQKIHFYTKNLRDTIEQFSKAVAAQTKKNKSNGVSQNREFSVQKIINDSDSLFINFQSKAEIKLKKGKESLTVDMVKQMIDTFQKYENYQNSVWAQVCLKDKNWSSELTLPWNEQQFRFKGFLEAVLHQLLFISEFKERLTDLENHLKILINNKTKITYTDLKEKKPVAKFIFAKKKPFPNLSEDISIVGKAIEVPTSNATKSETKMMEQRIMAFSNIAQQAKLCPKPYDKIAKLKLENQRLNEVFNDGWVTSQQYDKLKEQNEQLKQSINDLNNKIESVKKKLEAAKNRRKIKGGK